MKLTLSIRSLTIFTALSLLACAAGCATKFPEPHSALDVPTADLVMPPKEALATVKRVVTEPPLSLGVQSENKGTILTGYQTFPGE